MTADHSGGEGKCPFGFGGSDDDAGKAHHDHDHSHGHDSHTVTEGCDMAMADNPNACVDAKAVVALVFILVVTACFFLVGQ